MENNKKIQDSCQSLQTVVSDSVGIIEVSFNEVKIKKIKFNLPLYACVDGDTHKSYVKITDSFFTMLKVENYTNEHTFSRFKMSMPIAEVWFKNQIKEKEFNQVIGYARRDLSIV